jgi:hypothetical protein
MGCEKGYKECFHRACWEDKDVAKTPASHDFNDNSKHDSESSFGFPWDDQLKPDGGDPKGPFQAQMNYEIAIDQKCRHVEIASQSLEKTTMHCLFRMTSPTVWSNSKILRMS